MAIYCTTLLKGVQITRKTSTNIQRYSDNWLFVYFRLTSLFFSQSNFASARGTSCKCSSMLIQLLTFQSFPIGFLSQKQLYNK